MRATGWPSTVGRVSLGERLASRANALNAVRLCLALVVVVSHAPAMAGLGSMPSVVGVPLGSWAVGAFFCISGYLIPTSRVRHSAARYVLLRAARIYPGLWACLAVTAFIFGPAAAALTHRVYSPVVAAGYVWRNATTVIGQDGIGDTLVAAHTNAWNGSLWTLMWEVGCYILAGSLLSVPLLRRHQAGTAAALFVFSAVGMAAGNRLYAVWFLSCFSAGWLVSNLAHRIRASWGLAAASAGVTGILAQVPRAPYALPLAVTVLSIGALAPVRLGQRNDVSYGVYIYGWPAQQVLTLAGLPALGLTVYLAASLVAGAALGTLSWFLVERHFLPRRQNRQQSQSGASPESDLPPSGSEPSFLCSASCSASPSPASPASHTLGSAFPSGSTW